jgi:hypothetical protein
LIRRLSKIKTATLSTYLLSTCLCRS